jgi:hypothetical protein
MNTLSTLSALSGPLLVAALLVLLVGACGISVHVVEERDGEFDDRRGEGGAGGDDGAERTAQR